MRDLLKRYRTTLIVLAAMVAFAFVNYELGTRALLKAGDSIRQMLLLLPPIFVILGLMDVWVPRELMVRYMGESSGVRGVLLSLVFGSVTSGPLYAAFPVVSVLLKKGASFTNILIFLGAWSTTKVPMLLFEGTNLGWKFALVRLAIDVPGIVAIAYAIKAAMPKGEVEEIRRRCEAMDDVK